MIESPALRVSAPELPASGHNPGGSGSPRVEAYVFSNNACRWKYVRLVFVAAGLCAIALVLAILALCFQPATLPPLALNASPELPRRRARVTYGAAVQIPRPQLTARPHPHRHRHGLRPWQRSASRPHGGRTRSGTRQAGGWLGRI